jgi:hypothetical protein
MDLGRPYHDIEYSAFLGSIIRGPQTRTSETKALVFSQGRVKRGELVLISNELIVIKIEIMSLRHYSS